MVYMVSWRKFNGLVTASGIIKNSDDSVQSSSSTTTTTTTTTNNNNNRAPLSATNNYCNIVNATAFTNANSNNANGDGNDYPRRPASLPRRRRPPTRRH